MVWATVILAVLVGVLWAFPAFWYTRKDTGQKFIWLAEQTNVAGWTYRELPVSEAAESLLVADQLVNGEFTRKGGSDIVRVFSAKRFSEKPNDIGLFVHTPDRCWTEGGWRLEPLTPDTVETTVHGVKLVFERRLFVHAAQRELVYFGGLVGGQPLPYRLDHNLSVGMRSALRKAKTTGSSLRASDSTFWKRVWDSFTARRPLLGPKQFVRISVGVGGGDLADADKLLVDFLERWLAPVDYEHELKRWASRAGG